MKTNKTIAYGFLTVIIALAFIACPDEKTPESNPPVANAQAEPTHTLADNLSITLDGTDSTGNISAYAWECETYTADQGTVSEEYSKAQVNALITNANAETATVKPRKAGTYKFKLTVTGNDGESDTDTVTVVVEGYVENRTATAEIRIAAVPFVAGTQQKFFVDSNYYTLVVTDGTNADFADENIALITYIVEDETADPKIVWQSSNGAVTVSSIGYPNGLRTFTQTFTYKDKTVSRSIRLGVGSDNFTQMRGMEGTAQISELPAVKIDLEKEIEETLTELP